MIALGFLTNLSATLIMPSLPAYLEWMGAPGYLNGWVLSATGVATAIANPILGFWSDRRGVKEVSLMLFLSLFLLTFVLGLLLLSHSRYRCESLVCDEQRLLPSHHIE